MDEGTNRAAFNKAETVEVYARLPGLTPLEERLFEAHIPRGARVLDLGVGAGRTSGWLAERSGAYVGLDVAPNMIEAARRRFPGLDLRVLDAASFDAAVFSFNGLGYLHPLEKRRRCLSEIRRVLRPGGKFIFSAHNPRLLLARPEFEGAAWHKLGWRMLLACRASASFLRRDLPTEAFWTGAGYVVDPAHGGLLTYFTTPRRASDEARACGFRPLETAGGYWAVATPAYYYVWERPA